ncbi:hypothetical protein TIFTF001_032125 [Ficus carica]|uniref:Retrotransposon gag domain-containing protein n=1 Tax=Ficus carica TaxID=3494 RepID=A0AA88DVV5_FICCA|nr:hypothetical protein TIFTF001_032125 [Ficus carica]
MTAFRKVRLEHYYEETHPEDWLHHINPLCSSNGITCKAWARQVVIQLRGAAWRWWESIGRDLNIICWRDFRRNIMEHFAYPFLYRERMANLICTRTSFLYLGGRMDIYYDHLCSETIYVEMHLRAEMVDTPLARGLEDIEDTSSHVEVPVPHQPEVIGDNDARIGPKEEDPTEMFTEGDDAQPVVRQEPLYEKFRRKPIEFEESTDSLEAEEWLTSLQIVLNFMDLIEQEKVLCAFYVMKKDAYYWWDTVSMRRNVLEMTLNNFILKFNEKFYNRMAKKDERVRQISDMLRFEITTVIDSGERPPTTVVKCGKKHQGECKLSSNTCYLCGKAEPNQTEPAIARVSTLQHTRQNLGFHRSIRNV